MYVMQCIPCEILINELFLFLGDLGKAVGELVTVVTEDSKPNGQRAPPPAFKWTNLYPAR